MQEQIPATWDINDPKNGFVIVDPAKEAAGKLLCDLTLDEAITYRASEFFPSRYDNESRDYPVYARVDAKFKRALAIITREHSRTYKTNNRYIAVSLGLMGLQNKYHDQITECSLKFMEIAKGTDDEIYSMIDKREGIPQEGSIQQIRIGFSMAGQDRFEEMGDMLGLSPSGLVVVSFWFSALTSRCLPDHLRQYGTRIISSFELHLQKRHHDLSFSRK